MRSQPAFERLSFERKVNEALQNVERVLAAERHPKIAGDVEHTFGSKYILADMISNAALIGYMNVLEKLGLSASVLKSIDKNQTTTLRFEARMKSKFEKEVIVDVPMDRSYEGEYKTKSTGIFGNSESKRVSKAVQHVTEFHYKVETSWSISLFMGSSYQDKEVIQSRAISTNIISQTKDGLPENIIYPPRDLSLTWLLKHIDTDKLTSQFRVDVEDDETKTPCRNKAVDEGVNFSRQLAIWSDCVKSTLTDKIARSLLNLHNPALHQPLDFSLERMNSIHQEHPIFNPILPLMEDSFTRVDDSIDASNSCTITLSYSSENAEESNMLLSLKDMSKLLAEHARALDNAADSITQSYPDEQRNSAVSCVEYALVLFTHHVGDLSEQYIDSMKYIESLMEAQLISAVGKRLTSDDLDRFIRFHNANLLAPAPRPFSHAITRPNHNPVGLLSIEHAKTPQDECIYSHSRLVNAGSAFNISLNAATTLELLGDQWLHGWLNHRFGSNHTKHNLVARARQFSAFVLVIGTITGPSALEPKDAIIVQNKDEITIPLLVSELPTAREFKDAIKSLSPKQQQFARAFRAMQLSSSVFGMCVIQIKPQLETLLGLQQDSLDKEMKLTNDLMELFVEYQVPSDLLSYNGIDDNVASEDKVLKVKQNVKAVMDVIEGEKEKQLKAAKLKTDMVVEEAFQTALNCADFDGEYTCPVPAPAPRGADASNRRLMKAVAAPQMMAMTMAAAPPPIAMDMMSMAEAPPATSLFGTSSMKSQSRHHSETVEYRSSPGLKQASHDMISQQRLDFTLLPKVLDAAIEKSQNDTSLRSTVIKTSDSWVRNRQENILAPCKTQKLKADDIKKEKSKAFDLLDALSRSGTLPIKTSELHVVIAVTHCFEKDIIDTIVRENVDPIEKIEMSTLLFASTIHGVSARDLIRDDVELQRLEITMPLLLEQQQEGGRDERETRDNNQVIGLDD